MSDLFIENEDSQYFPWLQSSEDFPDKELITYNHSGAMLNSLKGKVFANKVKSLGSYLQKITIPQEKILILLPQGLEYSISLIACLYANVIAVPVFIFDYSRNEAFLEKIIKSVDDTNASTIITDTSISANIDGANIFENCTILNVDNLFQSEFEIKKERFRTKDDIAILLETTDYVFQSKRVMITHGSLIAQTIEGSIQWNIDKNSIVLSWMSLHHTFGLQFGFLAPLLTGASTIILSPENFFVEPSLWFNSIDRFKATHIAGPSIAFDYSISRISFSSIKELSLSSLKAIIYEGVPIQENTLGKLISFIQNLGINEKIICPHYGTTELGVITTKSLHEEMRSIVLDKDSLEQGKVQIITEGNDGKLIISSGNLPENYKVIIINPISKRRALQNEIGEIYIKSATHGKGYFNQKYETEMKFEATITEDEETGFYRTGYLGFLVDNNLYITEKNTHEIVINEKRYSVREIEQNISESLKLTGQATFVFSGEINKENRIVVMQEFDKNSSIEEKKELTNKIFISTYQTYGFEVHEILLIENGFIPKDSIGQVHRMLCRNEYLNGNLKVMYHQTYRSKARQMSLPIPQSNDWIAEKLIKEVLWPIFDINIEHFSTDRLLSELGIDSIKSIQISKRIEQAFQIEFTPDLIFRQGNINGLVNYISTQIGVFKLPINNRPFVKSDTSNKDIAVIGISCQFPGEAYDKEKFWDNLVNQKDCIVDISNYRPEILSQYKSSPDPSYTFPQWAGFVEDFDKFDASFFGISPKEAESMDPQQRKLLELTWSVIEDSGYNPVDYDGRNVGVFVGVHNVEYAELMSNHPELLEVYGAYLDSGLHMSMIANRVSRWFNFTGPSEVINTACSSSLVAINNAVESIYRGESCIAVAAGVNFLLSPRIFQACYKAGMLSSDGKCKTFDTDANGFVRAEGVGAVLLKPFAQAVMDGDPIYGIIKSVVKNHDGRSVSLRAPNLNAQKQLVKGALSQVDIAPETISYIEAHGTGTPIGDPIEVKALQEAFYELSPSLSRGYCGLGSVKTAIGHCESAAGIAGLIKVLLSMKHKVLPGNLHYKNLNPYLKLDESPFYVVASNQKWETLQEPNGGEIPRRAGISSFGFGGVNSHILVEEHNESIPLKEIKNESNTDFLIPLSAKNKKSLKSSAQQLLEFITKDHKINKDTSDVIKLSDIAYTLQVGRSAMDERIIFVTKDISQLIEQLLEFTHDKNNELLNGVFIGSMKEMKNYNHVIEDDIDEIIKMWVEKQKLYKIAQYWARGGKVNWSLLYNEVTPRRIHLPTYPFIKNRYWLIEKKESEQKNSNIVYFDGDNALSPKDKIMGDVMSVSPLDIEANFTRLNTDNFGKVILEDLTNYPIQIPKKANRDQSSIILEPLDNLAVNSTVELIPPLINKITLELQETLSELLFVMPSEVRRDISFVDLGLDSILGVEWVRVLNKLYGTTISLNRIYEYPTIEELARWLGKELSRRMEQFVPNSFVEPKLNNYIDNVEVAIQVQEPNETITHNNGMEMEFLKGELKGSLAGVLYIGPEEVDTNRSFIEMGLDSILSIEWIRQINQKYGTSISAMKIYDHPTICDFAIFLAEEISQTLTAVPTFPNRSTITSEGTELLSSNELTEELSVILANLLFISPNEVNNEKTFIELGLDSILGVELLRTLNIRFGTTIELNKIYEYPSIKEFIDWFAYFLRNRVITSPDSSQKLLLVNVDTSANAEERNEIKTDTTIQDSILTSEILEEELKASLATALYLSPEEMEPDRSFIEMGLDSILVIEWIGNINQKFGTSITTNKVYDYPTIHQFKEYLYKELRENLQGEHNISTLSSSKLTLDEILQQLYEGLLDIDIAKQLLKNHT